MLWHQPGLCCSSAQLVQPEALGKGASSSDGWMLQEPQQIACSAHKGYRGLKQPGMRTVVRSRLAHAKASLRWVVYLVHDAGGKSGSIK